MSDHSGISVEALTSLVKELEKAKRAATRLMISSSLDTEPPGPHVSNEVSELAEFLKEARLAILENPAGARSIVRLLVAEGQRYATTEAGADWQRRLLASEELEHLREMWEAVSLSIVDDLTDDQPVPTAWLDLIRDVAASRSSMDALIDVMRPGGLV
jgi:hypothetical protein